MHSLPPPHLPKLSGFTRGLCLPGVQWDSRLRPGNCSQVATLLQYVQLPCSSSSRCSQNLHNSRTMPWMWFKNHTSWLQQENNSSGEWSYLAPRLRSLWWVASFPCGDETWEEFQIKRKRKGKGRRASGKRTWWENDRSENEFSRFLRSTHVSLKWKLLYVAWAFILDLDEPLLLLSAFIYCSCKLLFLFLKLHPIFCYPLHGRHNCSIEFTLPLLNFIIFIVISHFHSNTSNWNKHNLLDIRLKHLIF